MCYRDPRSTRLIRENQNIDLHALRVAIALEGYRLGKADIYGPGWPKRIKVVENPRTGGASRKMEILKNYHFHLCFENTNTDYYCTEKIWNSIAGGCLPIYYGKGNKIYEDFPKHSFLDYSEFKAPQELFDFIDSMSIVEFRRRLNLCIEVYNGLYRRDVLKSSYEKILMNIVNKMKEITADKPDL